MNITYVDVTNLPVEVLAANPGLTNAVGNDGLDDSGAFQAAIDWLASQRTSEFTQEATIYVPGGVFDLDQSVRLDAENIRIVGAGQGLTVLQNSELFQVGTEGLPDAGDNVRSVNRDAYLFSLTAEADNISFSDLTLTGAEVHGAVFGVKADGLDIQNVEFNDFAWSAIRLFNSTNVSIADNTFIDAGGQANGTSGVTGGSIYATFLSNSQIYNNNIFRSGQREGNVYGIKGRKFSNTRIHNNIIDTNFSIELPFENDLFVEIDHNVLNGVVSIPKFSGGPVPEDGFTFHIHHNYFNRSYSLEWTRNGAEIDHNVFVFDPTQDRGNLISSFGDEPAQGPTEFHNNLILNPGRGIFWSRGVYDNFAFYNNEVIVNDTITPRTEGLFGFNPNTNFETIRIQDNVITVNGTPRPLVRNEESYDAVVENNSFVNIADIDRWENLDTGAPQGLISPLLFPLGVMGRLTVDGLNLTETIDSGNTAPVALGIDDIVVLEGETGAVIDLFEVFSDVETSATDLRYEVVQNSNSDLVEKVHIDPVTGQMTLEYASEETGNSSLTVRAIDPQGLSVETAFAVEVNDEASWKEDVADSEKATNIRLEAEHTSNVSNYQLEDVAIASNNQLLSLIQDGIEETGTVTFEFSQASGLYDVLIGTFDENDGLASFKVEIHDVETDDVREIGSTVLSEDFGINIPHEQTSITVPITSAVELTPGDRIIVTGTRNENELARLDYLELTSTSM